LSHFIISDKARAANASVFVAGWRSHLQHFASYDALSGTVARELGLSAVIAGLSAESLAETMTFEEVERRIIQDLKGRIIAGAGADMDTLRGLIARRRDGHWANRLLAHSSATTRALASCYDALEAAAAFFELKERVQRRLRFRHRRGRIGGVPDRAVPLRSTLSPDQPRRRWRRADGLGLAARAS
jgi:hypothetical protein